MPDIFKANIAGALNKALGNLVFDLTLKKKRSSERPGNLTEGIESVERVHACKGFVDDYKASQIDGTIIQRGDRKIVILGGSLSVVPEISDVIVAEGETRTIVHVTRDPAGATYECQSR